MGQFSVEKPVAPGSALSGNQHSHIAEKHLDDMNVLKGTGEYGFEG